MHIIFQGTSGLAFLRVYRLKAAFFTIWLTCSFQDRFSSMINPRCLQVLTLLRFVSLMWTLSPPSLIWDNLCLEPIIINSVLATLRLNLFLASRLLTLQRSLLRTRLSSLTFLHSLTFLKRSVNSYRYRYCFFI